MTISVEAKINEIEEDYVFFKRPSGPILDFLAKTTYGYERLMDIEPKKLLSQFLHDILEERDQAWMLALKQKGIVLSGVLKEALFPNKKPFKEPIR